MPIPAIRSHVGGSRTWDNRRFQKSARNTHNRHKINGLVDSDYFLRSQTLYPAELRAHSLGINNLQKFRSFRFASSLHNP
jgi:hypothetical protein